MVISRIHKLVEPVTGKITKVFTVNVFSSRGGNSTLLFLCLKRLVYVKVTWSDPIRNISTKPNPNFWVASL